MSVEDSWNTVDRSTGKKVPTQRHGRGKRWRVRNRGARTVSFDRRTDADAYDTKVKSDLLMGVIPFDHSAGRMTFATYTAKWLREKHYGTRSRSTVGSRIDNHLTPTFGHMRMSDIRSSTVSGWLADMRDKRQRNGEPYSASTINLVWVAFGSIMRAAVVDHVIAVHPCDGLTPPAPPSHRVTRVWETATVTTVLDGTPERHRPIPLLAATCGHRQGEAFAVAVEDVNFLRKQITIRHQVQRVDGRLTLVPPKRGRVRTVPLPEVTAHALAAHIEQHGTRTARCCCCRQDNAVLFFTDDGRLLSSQDWNTDVWHPVIRATDMTPSPTTGMHQLRHAYVSLLIDGGRSMKQIQEYVGHASIKVTADIYGHLFESTHDKARAVVDAAFGARVYPLRTADAS